MTNRVVHVSVHQTAKIVAILYTLMALVFVPIGVLFALRQGQEVSWRLLVLVPLLYGLASYVFGAVACWLYNVVAGVVGGIEFTVERDEDVLGRTGPGPTA
jgi:ABC-type dipeptide/oligopeptide/nickel transport system permease component